MNVIIANKYKDALSNLNIDVIKRMDGEFDVNTLVETFQTFYFNRMIIDITAIKDHFDITTIQKLSASLDATKIILFLDDDPRINNIYLSKIISLGIYNFTRELSGVTYLMENPNSYRDVAQYHDLANAGNGNNMVQSYQPGMSSNPQSQSLNSFNSQSVNNNFNNSYNYSNGPIIIGFKSLTEEAGSTTLIYMLKKILQHKKVLAVEVNKNDFSYFNDQELVSIQTNQIQSIKNKFKDFDYVLIDVNNSNLGNDGTCSRLVHLIEPSTIKLNSIMRRDRGFLQRIANYCVVLNKSLLSESDVKEFEFESKINIFYNIPPLDERKKDHPELISFLEKLGVNLDDNGGSSKSGLLGIFKK